MPRCSRIRSAVGVVGSLAPSTTTLQSMVRALVSFAITPPSAAGTSQSHGMVHSVSLLIAWPSANPSQSSRAARLSATTRCGPSRELGDGFADGGVGQQPRDVEPVLVDDAAVHV